MSEQESDIDLWAEYECVIRRHILPGHDVIDTVNRLLLKSPWLKDARTMLRIPRIGLRIFAGSSPLSTLWKLIHPAQITSDEHTTGAVLLLQWDGTDYLMDGRRRINHWQRNNVEGPHRVLTLAHENDDA